MTTGDHKEVAVKNIRDQEAGTEEGTYPPETNKGITRNNVSTVTNVGETRVRSENNGPPVTASGPRADE